MRAVVLAAGRGRRLGDLGATPKTLLPIDQDTTLLDVILGNLRAVGITDVAVVVGFAADQITGRGPDLEAKHGVDLRFVMNDRFTWNNAYSAWLATATMDTDTMLVNGDTLHPAAVEHTLMTASRHDDRSLLIAVDTAKTLGDEEMKVAVDTTSSVRRIDKGLDPAEASGEFIGVSLIRSRAVPALRDALERTWRADPDRYYEDGYQVFADDGHRIGAIPIGVVDWVEVDTGADLERAREIACRS